MEGGLLTYPGPHVGEKLTCTVMSVRLLDLTAMTVKSSLCVLSRFSRVLFFETLWTVRRPCSWDSLDKNTGVGCYARLQGIFLTQGSKPSLLWLLHWQVGSLPLVPPGEPLLIKTGYPWQCYAQSLSCVWLFASPWIAAHQTPLSMEFFKQEH